MLGQSFCREWGGHWEVSGGPCLQVFPLPAACLRGYNPEGRWCRSATNMCKLEWAYVSYIHVSAARERVESTFSVNLSLSTVAVGIELSHRLETPGTQGKPLSRMKGHYKGSWFEHASVNWEFILTTEFKCEFLLTKNLSVAWRDAEQTGYLIQQTHDICGFTLGGLKSFASNPNVHCETDCMGTGH